MKCFESVDDLKNRYQFTEKNVLQGYYYSKKIITEDGSVRVMRRTTWGSNWGSNRKFDHEIFMMKEPGTIDSSRKNGKRHILAKRKI